MGINLGDRHLWRVVLILGDFPISYLGLPLSSGSIHCRDWDNVIQRYETRLVEWNARLLSYGGRLVLYKLVLNCLPIYYRSIFQIRRIVVWKLDFIQVRFFWHDSGDQNKGWHDVAWDRIFKRQEEGGLCLRNIRDFNVALLCKWLWKLVSVESGLWLQVIQHRYYWRVRGWELALAFYIIFQRFGGESR